MTGKQGNASITGSAHIGLIAGQNITMRGTRPGVHNNTENQHLELTHPSQGKRVVVALSSWRGFQAGNAGKDAFGELKFHKAITRR